MKTHSNNEYELRMTDILLGKYATTVEYLKKFNVNIPSYDECKRMADSVEEAFLANLDKLLKDGELYLKMNGVFVQKAYWKKNEIRKSRSLFKNYLYYCSYFRDCENHLGILLGY
jgi:hypothetical protein